MIVWEKPPLILIVQGTGSANSEKGAFDSALSVAGIHEFNLIELSSIIPTGSEVYFGNIQRGEVRTSMRGSLLPVVLAKAVSTNATAAALALSPSPSPFIVEASGDSSEEVESKITAAYKDMLERRCSEVGLFEELERYNEMIRVFTSTHYKKDSYNCSLVAACFFHSDSSIAERIRSKKRFLFRTTSAGK